MPKALHDKLARQADKKGLKGDDRNGYIYGTMQKIEDNKTASHRAKGTAHLDRLSRG